MWKQPRCPSADEWVKEVWYIHSGILFSLEKGNPAICKKFVDEPGERYAK